MSRGGTTMSKGPCSMYGVCIKYLVATGGGGRTDLKLDQNNKT